MRRTTHTDRILTTRGGGRNMCRALENQGQRPRPECRHQRIRLRRHLRCPECDIGFWCDMDDDWMIRWPPFGGIDIGNGSSIFCIAAKPIDGLGRECHQLALLQLACGQLHSCHINHRHRHTPYKEMPRMAQALASCACAAAMVGATKVTWPILRARLACALPYKCKCAPGNARICSQAGSRIVSLSPSYQTSPRILSMTAGEC